ncbi:MAG: anthranilate synthase component I family protein [Burkholderiaceae bacterium]
MTELEFNALAAQGYNRIPLLAECMSDLDTPLSLYMKLAGSKNTFLLESVVGGERFGRYSMIGLPASTLLRVSIVPSAALTQVVVNGAVTEEHRGDPLAFIEQYQQRFKVALRPGLPRFCGGLAGYFGYDTVRVIEKKLAHTAKPGGVDVPDIVLLHCDELAVVDNVAGKLYLIVYADPHTPDVFARGRMRLRELRAKLARSVDRPHLGEGAPTTAHRGFAKADYLAAVEKTKELIAAGDCMQVQIGQRIELPFTESPLTLYRSLRSINPSPYMYYYRIDAAAKGEKEAEFHIVGASPEILVKQEPDAQGTKVIVRPIAGTRPRGNNPQHDQQLADELLADPKERAEHVMLIDLARNDIGRIAKIGSVKVTEQMVIEKYSHVQHIVSHVEGRLNDGLSNMDVLRATFPAGTLTGAPKVRAMEIIDEFEPVKRGIYGGAVGYMSYSGAMDLAIAIRTGIVKQGILHVQASGGVVADSTPEGEHAETEAKARALLRAAQRVQEGLEHE